MFWKTRKIKERKKTVANVNEEIIKVLSLELASEWRWLLHGRFINIGNYRTTCYVTLVVISGRGGGNAGLVQKVKNKASWRLSKSVLCQCLTFSMIFELQIFNLLFLEWNPIGVRDEFKFKNTIIKQFLNKYDSFVILNNYNKSSSNFISIQCIQMQLKKFVLNGSPL